MFKNIVARALWTIPTNANMTFKLIPSALCLGWESSYKFVSPKWIDQRFLHVGMSMSKVEDRKEMLGSMPKRDEGTEGEKAIAIDSATKGLGGVFPDETTPNLLFDGVRFTELAILNIKVSKNNTIMTLSNNAGKVKLLRSCGIEGFKNTRKGTNIAAQATAISLASRTLERGIKNVRVKIQGIGAGRMSAIKGLTMGGLNVVSITDCTPISFNNTPKPRKAKKL